MATFVNLTATTLYGTSWTGTAPGAANPSVSGTISSSTDLSAYIKSVSVTLDAEEVDFTNFGAAGWKETKTGLLTADVSITFFNDYASSSIDSILYSAITSRTLAYWDFKPTSSARGTTNPSLVFALYCKNFDNPMQVGAAQECTANFALAGKYARLTS